MTRTPFAGKKVLLTGATGLVGSWLAKALREEGAEVVALVRDWDPQSEYIRNEGYKQDSIVNGALEDYFAVERAINEHEVSIVFHLAAQAIVGAAHRSPLPTLEANVRGTYNLLEACRVHADRVKAVVVASSDKAYGTSPELPYVESMPLRGLQPYEVSKSCADLIAQSYAHTYAMPVVIGRCGNIYGGGDLNWSRIIPGTIRSLLNGQRPEIRSDGTFLRDYIYVKDVASAYLAMAQAALKTEHRGEGFNFSPEKALSVLDVVAAVQRAVGREDLQPVIRNEAVGEIHSQYLDASKANRELGWSPKYSLDQGLVETVKWYREYLGTSEKQVVRV